MVGAAGNCPKIIEVEAELVFCLIIHFFEREKDD